jgi:hypothetical protein
MKSTVERQRRSSLRAETMPRLARDLVASRPCRLPGAASSPAWDCATAGGRGARTRSAGPRTPACGTCRSRATPRTSCGARSSPWPASCWPGHRCSSWPGPRAAGSRNGSAYGSSPPWTTEIARARGTPPTRRDSRATWHGPYLKIIPSRTPQASRSQARKIRCRQGIRWTVEQMTAWASGFDAFQLAAG